MEWSYTDIITTVGFSAMAGGFIYVGRKLQILDDIQEDIKKLKANLKVVTDYLTHTHAGFDSRELQNYNPLQLSPEGDKLIKKIGFDKVFAEHKDDFFTCIDSENPKLKYDVENAAIKSVSLLYDKEYMSFLKVFFYNNPTRNLQNMAPTLGVYIRDRYLAGHPEISE